MDRKRDNVYENFSGTLSLWSKAPTPRRGRSPTTLVAFTVTAPRALRVSNDARTSGGMLCRWTCQINYYTWSRKSCTDWRRACGARQRRAFDVWAKTPAEDSRLQEQARGLFPGTLRDSADESKSTLQQILQGLPRSTAYKTALEAVCSRSGSSNYSDSSPTPLSLDSILALLEEMQRDSQVRDLDTKQSDELVLLLVDAVIRAPSVELDGQRIRRALDENFGFGFALLLLRLWDLGAIQAFGIEQERILNTHPPPRIRFSNSPSMRSIWCRDPAGAAAYSALPPLPSNPREELVQASVGLGFLAFSSLAILGEIIDPIIFHRHGSEETLVLTLLFGSYALDRFVFLFQGRISDTVDKGIRRIVGGNREREAFCDAASFVVAYLLGIPDFAFRPRARLCLEWFKKVADQCSRQKDAEQVNPLLEEHIALLTVWLLSRTAAECCFDQELIESETRQARIFVKESLGIQIRTLSAQMDKRSSPGDDVSDLQRIDWEDFTLRWAFVEAMALVRANMSLIRQIAKKMHDGGSVGELVCEIERHWRQKHAKSQETLTALRRCPFLPWNPDMVHAAWSKDLESHVLRALEAFQTKQKSATSSDDEATLHAPLSTAAAGRARTAEAPNRKVSETDVIESATTNLASSAPPSSPKSGVSNESAGKVPNASSSIMGAETHTRADAQDRASSASETCQQSAVRENPLSQEKQQQQQQQQQHPAPITTAPETLPGASLAATAQAAEAASANTPVPVDSARPSRFEQKPSDHTAGGRQTTGTAPKQAIPDARQAERFRSPSHVEQDTPPQTRVVDAPRESAAATEADKHEKSPLAVAARGGPTWTEASTRNSIESLDLPLRRNGAGDVQRTDANVTSPACAEEPSEAPGSSAKSITQHPSEHQLAQQHASERVPTKSAEAAPRPTGRDEQPERSAASVDMTASPSVKQARSETLEPSGNESRTSALDGNAAPNSPKTVRKTRSKRSSTTRAAATSPRAAGKRASAGSGSTAAARQEKSASKPAKSEALKQPKSSIKKRNKSTEKSKSSSTGTESAP